MMPSKIVMILNTRTLEVVATAGETVLEAVIDICTTELGFTEKEAAFLTSDKDAYALMRMGLPDGCRYEVITRGGDLTHLSERISPTFYTNVRQAVADLLDDYFSL